MICPSCGKFASYDTGNDPELDLEVENGVVTGTVRIVLTSECCGDELKEATFDVDMDLSEEVIAAIRAAESLASDATVDLEDYEFDISDDGAEVTDRYESERRKVKKDGTVVIKQVPARYQRRYFGVHVDLTVDTTAKNGTTVSVSGTFDDEVQTSGMDELV